MTEQAKKFAELLSADEALRAELDEVLKDVAIEDQAPLVIEFAKKKGYDILAKDPASDDADLSLDELAAITGGGECCCFVPGTGSGHGLVCSCNQLGSGKDDEWGTCFCTNVGTGVS